MTESTMTPTPVEVHRIEGEIDEIVADGVHLEFMDTGMVYLNLHDRTFWISSKKKITITEEAID